VRNFRSGTPLQEAFRDLPDNGYQSPARVVHRKLGCDVSGTSDGQIRNRVLIQMWSCRRVSHLRGLNLRYGREVSMEGTPQVRKESPLGWEACWGCVSVFNRCEAEFSKATGLHYWWIDASAKHGEALEDVAHVQGVARRSPYLKPNNAQDA